MSSKKDRYIPRFKTHHRDSFDGHRRLAAAVIIQAIRDLSSAKDETREDAIGFLKSPMEPFALVIDLPEGAVAPLVRKAEAGALKKKRGPWSLSINL